METVNTRENSPSELFHHCRDIYLLKIKVRYGLGKNPELPNILCNKLLQECQFEIDKMERIMGDYRSLLESAICDASVPISWRQVCKNALCRSLN